MANPFMVTSNECYGMSLLEASKRAAFSSPIESGEEASTDHSNNNRACGALPGMMAEEKNSSSTSQDLSFLYSRESDRFGKGCTFSDSSLSKVFRLEESDSMNKRRKNSVFVKQLGNSAVSSSKKVAKEEVDEIISQYNHNPKGENPLYGTTGNEYGSKKPSAATYTTERHGVSQKFSKSFNRTMYRDEGLNASMTRSNIHDSLTPQFV